MYKKLTGFILIFNLLVLSLPQKIWAVGQIAPIEAVEDCQVSVDMSLSSDHGGSSTCNHLGTGGGVVYPVIGFNNTELVVPESAGQIVLPISLSFPPSLITNVNYRISGSYPATATSGQDYYFNAGSLELVPGQTEASIQLMIREDEKPEASETFQIELVDPSMTTFSGNEKVTITITDNDQAGINFSKDSYQITRGINPVSDKYSISLKSDPGGFATITPELIGGAGLVNFLPEKIVFDSTNWQSGQEIRIIPTETRFNFAQENFPVKHNIVSSNAFYQNLVISQKNLNVSNYYGTGGSGSGNGGGGSTTSGSNSSANTSNSTANNNTSPNNANLNSTNTSQAQTTSNSTAQVSGNGGNQIATIDPYSPNLISAIPSTEAKVVQKETNPFPGRVFILNTGKRSEAGQAIKNVLVKEISKKSLEEISVVELSTIARFVAFGTNLTKDYSQEQRAKAIAKFQEQKKKLPTNTIELLEAENLTLVKK